MFNHAYLPGVINRADDVYGALPESKMWKKDGGWGPLLPFDQWPEHERLAKALPDIQKLLNSVDVLGACVCVFICVCVVGWGVYTALYRRHAAGIKITLTHPPTPHPRPTHQACRATRARLRTPSPRSWRAAPTSTAQSSRPWASTCWTGPRGRCV